MEVIIVVDWKEVSMDISVSQQYINTRDAMDGLEEAVELPKATRTIPL